MFATLAWLPLFLSPQEPGHLSVRVTDAVSAAPVAGAEVVCVSLGKLDELRWRPPISDVDYWESARTSGSSLRTDGDGLVAFAGFDGGAIVSCIQGELYAERWVMRLQPEPVELALERDIELCVRTLDARGAPLEGVAVGLMSRSMAMPGVPDSRYDSWFAIAESDATGMARVPHAQRWLRDHAATPVELTLAIPCLEPQRIVVDPNEPIDGRIFELVVPPTGSVRLRATGVARGYARLRAARPVGRFGKTNWSNYEPLRAGIVDGVAEFAYVGAGVELEYEANWAGLTQPRRGRAPGIIAHARSEIRLDGPGDPAVLVGRLLDEDLRPIASAAFAVTTIVHTGGSSRSTNGRSTTSEDGRFCFELPEPAPPSGQRRILEFRHGAPQNPAYARFELTSSVLVRDNDLRDLMLCAAGSDARVRRMNDDELELEYARNAKLLRINYAWARDVQTCATEMSRRGGERWITFLRRELELVRRDEEVYGDLAWNSASDFALLIALRRAERKPDPAMLEIGPQSRLDTTLPELPRFAVRVRNVDPVESFTYSDMTYKWLRIEARTADGRVPPRRSNFNSSGSWPSESGPLRPGASSTDGGYHDWIDVDLGEQLELVEAGEYEVRLLLSLDDEIAFEHDVRGYLCALSAPVTIRVRVAAK